MWPNFTKTHTQTETKLLPSILAIFVLREVEIWEALLSNASLNCCEDQANRFDSISLVQQVPAVEGHIDRGTPANEKKQ